MRRLVRRMPAIVASLGALVASTTAAQVVAPSFYATNIQVQGEAPGTEYDDWAASGITVIDMDPVDNPGDVDLANVQIANDDEFIYIRLTTHNTTPLSLANVYLAFDTDQNKTTGFDILQIGEIGSELGYQTDYPFAQHSSTFNLGLSLTGGPIGNGGALIFPFWGGVNEPPVGTGYEWAVPLDVVIQYPPVLGGPSPGFPNPSFDFAIYTNQGLADITQVIRYTLATAPGQLGDFDGDLDVDGADFIEWQQALGNGLDADDLVDWKAHFGTAPGLAASRAIPEPAALAVAVAGMAGVGAVRRRTRRAVPTI